jgi:hypothetical protein
LAGCDFVDNYVDDMIGHTTTWTEHMTVMRELLRRLAKAEPTIKPSKCYIGYNNIGFTEHMVGHGIVQIDGEKLTRIKEAEVQKTKRQVRAFIGLAGYYRRFIPSFAEIATPLTDLSKKGLPKNVRWGDEQKKAFNTL